MVVNLQRQPAKIRVVEQIRYARDAPGPGSRRRACAP
jgi:hypothetical protein